MSTDLRIMVGDPTFGLQTIYYLSNSTGSPVRDGDPTAAATTPFALINDGWTMQDGPPAATFSGGPPFRSGSALAYQSYPNTLQSIPIAVWGSDHNHAALKLRGLRKIISQAVMLQPAILSYQPSGATYPLYYNIVSGYLQERPDPTNPVRGFGYLEADLILTMTPFGGLLETGETLLNGVTFGNYGDGVPLDNQAFSTGAGDMVYEGSPLNLDIRVATSLSRTKTMVAAVIAATSYAAGGGAKTTSDTDGVLVDTMTFNIATISGSRSINPRYIARILAPSSNAEIRIKVFTNTYSTTPIYISPWLAPGALDTMLDFGTWPLDAFRLRAAALSNQLLYILVYLRSTDGGACTATFDSYEGLSYYTYCIISGVVDNASTQYTLVNSFREESGAACLPVPSPAAYAHFTATGDVANPLVIRGQVPRYFVGSSLWLAWLAENGQQDVTDTAVVVATHGPQWHTMRGSG